MVASGTLIPPVGERSVATVAAKPDLVLRASLCKAAAAAHVDRSKASTELASKTIAEKRSHVCSV
jgi:hypothetical protein